MIGTDDDQCHEIEDGVDPEVVERLGLLVIDPADGGRAGQDTANHQAEHGPLTRRVGAGRHREHARAEGYDEVDDEREHEHLRVGRSVLRHLDAAGARPSRRDRWGS